MKFFFSSCDINEKIQGTLIGSNDLKVNSVSDLSNIKDQSVCFIQDEKYINLLKNSFNSLLIADECLDLNLLKQKFLNNNNAIIIVKNSYSKFIDLVYLLEEEKAYPFKNDNLSKSEISSTAKIFPNVFIDIDVKIGSNTIIFPGTSVLRGSRIGNNTTIYPNASILHSCIIGNNCQIASGTVIGYDGFGYLDVDGIKKKIPHIGRVIIGDNVEIGANTCIDRGTISDTIISDNSKIDNLVHIAHNCIIGTNCIICGMTGLCGNTELGNNVIMAAKSGTKGHLKIEDDCIIAARTSVTKNLKKGSLVKGYPARALNEELKIQTLLGKLPDLYNRLKELERRLNNVNSK